MTDSISSLIYAMPRDGVVACYVPSKGAAVVMRWYEKNEYNTGLVQEELRRRWDESEHKFLVRLDHAIADAIDEWDKRPVFFTDENDGGPA